MHELSFTAFLIPAIISLVFMIIVFIISLIKRDNSVADIAWGLGFILITITSLVQNPVFSSKQLLILVLVSLWGIRLAIHITMRNHGKSEDFRYKEWRTQWGKQLFLKSFFQVYILQWIFMQGIASSIVIISTYGASSITTLDIIGVVLWSIGFFFESVGDYQLLMFKRDATHKDMIMDKGLWNYTRHPNYFGEVTQWWGIFVIALSGQYGLLAIVSPLLITTLILKVSGIPLLEKKYIGNQQFELYKQKTGVFFPLCPKKQ